MKKFGHGEHVTNTVWTETGSEELHCCPTFLVEIVASEHNHSAAYNAGLEDFFLAQLKWLLCAYNNLRSRLGMSPKW